MNGKVDRIRLIESAEKFVKAGKLKEAIAEYKKLQESDPQDFGVSNILGDLHARLGQNEKAARAFLIVAGEFEKRSLHSQALAVYKKIAKIKPDDPDISVKLADLYSLQGFQGEALSEYGKTAVEFRKAGKLPEAVRIYEKIVRLDKENSESKYILAQLYMDTGEREAAVELFDEIAEASLGRDNLEEAEKLFLRACEILPTHPRTIVGLVEVYRKKGNVKKAIETLDEALKLDNDNPRVLTLLGSIYFEDGDFARAEEIFSQVVATQPMNVNARIKLGRIFIRKEDLDRAYELLEPLINNLIKKQKEDKAVGLLGLILGGKKNHLPSLEKLSSIYRSGKDFAKLEIVDRVILEEQRRVNPGDKVLATLSELIRIRPDDSELLKEYKVLRKEMGLPEEDLRPETSWVMSDKDRDVIRQTLEQADLYIKQGLVRNARRILENLRMKYSDDPLIMEKIMALDDTQSQMSEDEIRIRVEKAQALESRIVRKSSTAFGETEEKSSGGTEAKTSRARGRKTPQPPAGFSPFFQDEEKISTADIFAETDIIPFISAEPGERKYYNLADIVETERRMMEACYERQTSGATVQFEKELSVIVSDFKKGLADRVGSEDYEIHFQLGIAFMEQGLYQEAVEEFSLAAKDASRSVECFSAVSRCFRLRNDFQEAERWLNKAMLIVKKGTDAYYSLLYDQAMLSEDARDMEKALSLYREVRKWNPAYRHISEKVEDLEKTVA